MSRILKRPMFRRGGSTNTGIMSGLVDRRNYSTGKFGSMTKDEIRSNIDLLRGLQDQFSPLPKTRLPLGEVGLALASGAPIVDALTLGYKKFVSDDDKRRALATKRDQAAVSTVLGQALKTPKDKRTTAQKNADVLEELGVFKTPEEKAKYIQAATIRTEAGAADLQGQGQVAGKGKRDDIINSKNFVERQLTNIDEINKLLEEDPTLGGGVGQLRKLAFDTITLGSDFGIDVSPLVKKFGGEETLLNTNTARLEALEDLLVPGLARVMNPNTRITNQMLNEAKAAINLTGLKGSEAVQTKLKEIKSQFEQYIADQNKLLGVTTPKKYKVVNGKLVEQ